MDAMILAAGLGTRLRPLTDELPKALVPVAGRPLLAHVLDRLVAAGTTRVVVNTHHHADRIAGFLETHGPSGIEIVLSPEPDGPYDTGGGLLAAAPLLRRDAPFLLHNVDVISRIPLTEMLTAHRAAWAREPNTLMATVAVQRRDATRRLLFDDRGLTGWENRAPDGTLIAEQRGREPVGAAQDWSFTGIHVIEPAMLDLAERTGSFSVITWYLDLVRRGYTIQPFDASAHAWIDVGTHERLAQAEAVLG